jgi:hypothetical protein
LPGTLSEFKVSATHDRHYNHHLPSPSLPPPPPPQERVSSAFPVVYDTKHLAASEQFRVKPTDGVTAVDSATAAVTVGEANSTRKPVSRFPDTSLGSVYATLKAEVSRHACTCILLYYHAFVHKYITYASISIYMRAHAFSHTHTRRHTHTHTHIHTHTYTNTHAHTHAHTHNTHTHTHRRKGVVWGV